MSIRNVVQSKFTIFLSLGLLMAIFLPMGFQLFGEYTLRIAAAEILGQVQATRFFAFKYKTSPSLCIAELNSKVYTALTRGRDCYSELFWLSLSSDVQLDRTNSTLTNKAGNNVYRLIFPNVGSQLIGLQRITFMHPWTSKRVCLNFDNNSVWIDWDSECR